MSSVRNWLRKKLAVDDELRLKRSKRQQMVCNKSLKQRVGIMALNKVAWRLGDYGFLGLVSGDFTAA